VAQATEELLAARRLRSAELALDAARARLVESHDELDALRARVAALESRLLAREAEFAAERERLLGPDARLRQAQLADAVRRRVNAEQELQAERRRADELEALLRGEGPREEVGGVERELGTALRRIAALEGELELVRRRASEIEHQVRASVDVAWDWLEQVAHRFEQAIGELEALRAEVSAAELPAALGPHPDELSGVVPERLDAARSRLRASVPEEPDPDPAPARDEPRRRFLRR
jgi:predicted  nucleic acid-binding Zn-ribbon protein